MDLVFVQATLERAGVVFGPGMHEREIDAVERKYDFRFPPDLKRFLMHALPISQSWVNWREDDEARIRARLSWPYEGICFDIEYAQLWLDSWGERPGNREEAFAVAKKAVDAAPRLIPVFSHRYMPDRPCEEGNPVFSVHQSDIIYYGADLRNWLENEFHYYFETEHYVIREPVRTIDLWTELVGLLAARGWRFQPDGSDRLRGFTAATTRAGQRVGRLRGSPPRWDRRPREPSALDGTGTFPRPSHRRSRAHRPTPRRKKRRRPGRTTPQPPRHSDAGHPPASRASRLQLERADR